MIEEPSLNQTFKKVQQAIKFTELCRATRFWHDSDSNVVPLSRQTKFINCFSVFWRDCVPTRNSEENCYEASVNPEFGSTPARHLNQSCFSAGLQANHGRSTTSELGLRPETVVSKIV